MRTHALAAALGLMGLLGLAPSAGAMVVYAYTGNSYDSVAGGYTTSMQITGTILVPVRLGPNLTNQDVSAGVESYSFHDGLQTLAGQVPVAASFIFSTDQNGGIVTWSVDLSGSAGSISSSGPPLPVSDLIDSGSDLAGSFGQVTGAGSGANAQGLWAIVPEPSTAGLLALGLGLLVGSRRWGR